MRCQIISFTQNGIELSKRIAGALSGDEVFLYTKCSYAEKTDGVIYEEKSVREWTREKMSGHNALLFVGACGIAVRSLAPCMTDKLQDNPVLVIDEKGRFVIPLLSGHMGGANELAGKLAQKLDAVPVITTATDLNDGFAVDLFAKQNGLWIENKDGIAKISAKVLAGEKVGVYIEPGHWDDEEALPQGLCLSPYPAELVIASSKRESASADFASQEVLLCLRPKEYVVGMGCKKGKKAEEIEAFLREKLTAAGIRMNQVCALSSIDAKKEEEGLLAFCQKENIPFFTFSAKRLLELKGDFHASAFVEAQVGVDNVCERAALAPCGPGGSLIMEKQAQDGMTLAIAKREWKVSFTA